MGKLTCPMSSPLPGRASAHLTRAMTKNWSVAASGWLCRKSRDGGRITCIYSTYTHPRFHFLRYSIWSWHISRFVLPQNCLRKYCRAASIIDLGAFGIESPCLLETLFLKFKYNRITSVGGMTPFGGKNDIWSQKQPSRRLLTQNNEFLDPSTPNGNLSSSPLLSAGSTPQR